MYIFRMFGKKKRRPNGLLKEFESDINIPFLCSP